MLDRASIRIGRIQRMESLLWPYFATKL
jgi:hypothetical protein